MTFLFLKVRLHGGEAKILNHPRGEDHFSCLSQIVLPKLISNHCPIVHEGKGIKKSNTNRFEKMWFKHDGFKDLIRNWWTGYVVSRSSNHAKKLKAHKKDLKVWNKEVFGNVPFNEETLSHISFCDSKKRVAPLSVEEAKARMVALKGKKVRNFLETKSREI